MLLMVFQRISWKKKIRCVVGMKMVRSREIPGEILIWIVCAVTLFEVGQTLPNRFLQKMVVFGPIVPLICWLIPLKKTDRLVLVIDAMVKDMSRLHLFPYGVRMKLLDFYN